MRSDVPPRYHPAFEAVTLPPRVSGWSGSPWSVVITGPNGVGKSWMAAKLAHPFQGVGWVNCSTLRAKLQREIDFPTSEPRLVERLSSIPLLVLDDMSSARNTTYIEETIRHVICHRYDYVLPTIITMDEVNLEGRLASRLAEGAVIQLSGPDQRRKRGDK